MRKLLVIVLVALWPHLNWAQISSPQVKPFIKVDAPVVALTHVRVIDGTGAPAREDQTLILQKGKIDSVGAASTANVPKDARRGRLLPGALLVLGVRISFLFYVILKRQIAASDWDD